MCRVGGAAVGIARTCAARKRSARGGSKEGIQTIHGRGETGECEGSRETTSAGRLSRGVDGDKLIATEVSKGSLRGLCARGWLLLLLLLLLRGRALRVEGLRE